MANVTVDFRYAFRYAEKKVFFNEKDARDWLMDGIRHCDGAERNHYVDMLVDLEDGEHYLYY